MFKEAGYEGNTHFENLLSLQYVKFANLYGFFYQTGFLGLWGRKVDAIEHYIFKIEKLSTEVSITLMLHI